MKGTLRKFTSLLLTFCMLFTLVPTSVVALDGGNSDTLAVNGKYTGSTWAQGGDGTVTYNVDGTPIQLSKTAVPVEGQENTFDVTLKVVTSTSTSVQTDSGAVVLVMDVSNSMAYCEACSASGDHKSSCKYHKSGWFADNSIKTEQTRIYAAKQAARDFLASYAGTDASAVRMISVVKFGTKGNVVQDWLNVAGGPGCNDYDRALAAINSVAISNNNSDGGTNLEAGLYQAKTQLDKNTVSTVGSKNVVLLTDGKPTYRGTGSSVSGNGQDGSSNNNNAAKNQADAIKAAGSDIYTVIFGNANESTYSGGPTVGNFLKDSIATSADTAYEASNADALDEAFQAISQTIVSGFDGSGWTATDPMANFISVSGAAPSNFQTADGNTYTWTLSDPKRTEAGGVSYYEYTCTYRVTLDVQGIGFEEGKYYPTNEKTFLNAGDQRFEFPVPGVKGFLPRTDVSVKKVWSDNNDQDRMRTESVTVQLLKDGNAFGDQVVLNGENNWEYKWSDLIDMAEGHKNVYTVQEVNVPEGYTPQYTRDGNNLVITNKHNPIEVSVPVEKVWNDAGNQDGIRPESVTIRLYADGEVVTGKVLTLDKNNWSGSFTGLPKFDAGREIQYTISEDTVNKYSTEITGNAKDGFVVTNSYTPETTSVDVEKVWNDANNQDGIRLNQVTVRLYVGDDAVPGQVLVLNEDNDWAGSFTDLPKRANGSVINYTVKEDAVAKYEAVVTGSMADGFTVTNSYVPETTSVDVEKVWDDADDQDGARPDSVTVRLYVGDEAVEGQVVTLNEDNGWEASFTDLPKYNAGKIIEYTVKEDSVAKYTATVTGSKTTGFVVTNSHVPETTSVDVEKVWNDADDQDGVRPGSVTVRLYVGDDAVEGKVLALNEANDWEGTFGDLPKYSNGQVIDYTVKEDSVEGYTTTIEGSKTTGFVVTNSHIPATTSVAVEKVWNDADDQDGIRPDSVTIRLYVGDDAVEGKVLTLNDGNDWEGSFTGLPKNANGQPINYTVKEDAVTGYEVAYTGTIATGFVVTNTHVTDTTSVDVTKVWNDADDQDAVRPDSVTVYLYADGVKVDGKELTLNEDGNWTGSFTDLQKNKAGKPINYTVDEANVAEYTKAITGTMADGYTITNTHVTYTTSVDVTKVWNDADDQDGIRPDSVTVRLYVGDEAVEGQVVTLNEANDWSATFTDLQKNENGTAINYTVKEDAVTGYTVVYTGSMAAGYTVTNTHVTDTTSVDVTKVWNDADDQDGIRPDSVTVYLYADGVKVDGKELTLTKADNWTGSFTDLQKNKAGSPITYTVDEANVAEYTKAITGTMADGYTITNTHVTYTTSVDVTKVWNDKNDQDGIRPDSVTVYLYADGVKVDEKVLTLDATGNWTGSFTGLQMNKEGKPIAYTVDEAKVTGYTKAITGTMEDGYTITNSHTTATTSVDVEKKWVDNDDQDGIRPDNVVIRLFADGTLVNDKVLILNEENGWEGSFTDLQKNNDGQPINYTIQEDAVTGYTKVITGTMADGYTVTNTHEVAKTSVDVEKVWNDADDQDGARPDSVTVRLLANGNVVEGKVLTLSEANGWAGTFTDLDVNAEGKAIAYTVTEDAVAEYTTKITGDQENGYTVTNSHEVAKTSVNVTKVWDDKDDQDGIRKDSVTIRIFANGTKLEDKVLVLNEENSWTGSFTGLDKFKNGVEIAYTVAEDEVEKYQAKVTGNAKEGFVVTNSYEPAKTSVPVTKVWNDADDQDKVRPDSVTVRLLANGETVEGKTLTLDEENGWADSFTGLDKYSKGKEIAYTVEEDAVAEYTTKITGDQENGYTVTNTHQVYKTSVDVTKKWNDNDDQDKVRPESVTVRLYANGTAVEGKVLTLSEDNKWSGTFDDLDVNAGGKAIAYTVEEDAVAEYTTKITGDQENGYTVTNTHEVYKTSVDVIKNWDDADNQDGVRPESVTIRLLANGKVVEGKVLTLSEANSWSGTFTDLDENAAGKKIEYTVSEDAVAEYTTKIDGSNEAGFVVTNSHETYTTSVKVTKTWDDADNQDGLRPSAITVNLLADGELAGKTITLNEENGWAGEFSDLPMNKAGKAIVYTVAEEEVAGYTTTIVGDMDSVFEITNTHEPETTSVAVSKVWNDKNDKDKMRPNSITVRLYANGTAVEGGVLELTKADKWSGTFDNLPKFNAGEEIIYMVREDVVKGYTTEIVGDVETGYVITNSHTPLPPDENLDPDDDPKDDDKKPIPDDKNLPNTGDDADKALLFNMFVLALSGFAALKLRRKEDEE